MTRFKVYLQHGEVPWGIHFIECDYMQVRDGVMQFIRNIDEHLALAEHTYNLNVVRYVEITDEKADVTVDGAKEN